MGLTLNASISQFMVAAKDHVSRPHLDSLRKVQRSASDVCMGVDGTNGDVYTIFVIPDFRHHRRYFWMPERQCHDLCLSLGRRLHRAHRNTNSRWQRSRSHPWKKDCLSLAEHRVPSLGDQIQIRFQS